MMKREERDLMNVGSPMMDKAVDRIRSLEADLAAARQLLAEQKITITADAETIKALNIENLALHDIVAEAKKDIERLDWWFRHISSHYITYNHLTERWVVVKVRDMKNCSEWQDSKRAATDAARAAEDNADE